MLPEVRADAKRSLHSVSVRILYVSNSLDVGGVETNLVGLGEQLRKRGHMVAVASSGGTLEGELVRHGVRHINLSISLHAPVGLLAAAVQLRQLAERERYEVVHSMSAAGNLATVLMSRRAAVVFVRSAMGL